MAVEIRVPQMGESVTEAVVGQWLKKEGDTVQPGEPVVSLETDKVAQEVSMEQGGVLSNVVKHEGDTVVVGDVLATLADLGAPAQPSVAGDAPLDVSTPAAPTNGAAAGGPGRPLVTPVARNIAEVNNVDLTRVPGSGPRGKVRKDDVAAFVARDAPTPAGQPAAAPQAPPVQPSSPAASSPGLAAALAGLTPPPNPREERVRMTRRRQTIARRLVEAQQTAAMLTTFNEVDMSAVMEVRKRRRDAFKERHGVGLGFMSFFTKAVVGALKAYPRLNAEIQGDEFVLKRHYDIGIAVGAEEGLVVPVLRDADRKSFAEIEQEIADMAGRARANKLTLAELQGGTFTITNGGIFGSLLSTPILNTPEVGILGMHKIQERPVALKGEVVIRPMMYLALSYDHRIVDGREAVQGLVRIKDLLEDPETLLLEG